MKYLALGDSYTIGEGVAPAQRWADVLASRLRAQGIAIDAPRVIATTGWTTDELSAAMDAAEPLGTWDFVSLMVGVNNQYRGRDCASYRADFETLLRRAIALAGGRSDRVLVLSIPDWGATRFGAGSGRDLAQVSRELDAWNAAASEVSETLGVPFVDVTGVARERGGEDGMLVDDGLHPSAAMHALWADAALPVASQLLAASE